MTKKEYCRKYHGCFCEFKMKDGETIKGTIPYGDTARTFVVLMNHDKELGDFPVLLHPDKIETFKAYKKLGDLTIDELNKVAKEQIRTKRTKTGEIVLGIEINGHFIGRESLIDVTEAFSR